MGNIREIPVSWITDEIREMSIKANHFLSDDMEKCLNNAFETEQSTIGKNILGQLKKNLVVAGEEQIPICQDTGMAVVFLDIGQDVHLTGGDLTEAVNEGVRLGYQEGYLRKSVVGDPLTRENTGDNTPAILHTSIIPGNEVRITLAPKGFGSENMSAIKMLTPSYGVEGVKSFILDTVRSAGPNPCPPIVVGVGIGGTFERAAQLAKKATFRKIDTKNPDERYANLEDELLNEINKMGFGPAGLGGKTCALGVNIETSPTHIAGMPVAVNICCHAARHKSAEI